MKRKKAPAPKQKKGTTLTLSADELSELARFVAAGAVMLQAKPSTMRHIKRGLKRFDIKPPIGL